MAGIILGALGGAGEELAKIGATRMKAEIDSDARTQESGLALQRAKTLEEFKATLKMSLDNQERAAQVARVDQAAGAIADEKVGAKRGIIEGNIADKSAWTPEQQAAVDQSLEIDRKGIVGSARTRTEAAIRTGDIAPKDAATLQARDDESALRERLEMLREEGRNARDDRRAELQEQRIQAMLELGMARLEKAGKKADDAATAKEALAFLDGTRKQLQSEEQNLRQLYQAQIKDKSRAEVATIEAEYKPKFAEIARKRSEIEEDYGAVRERVGLPARTGKPAAAPPPPGGTPAPAPKPAASAPAVKTLPPGSRQIGTSGGKPVYETPDGKRFIAQ